MRGGCQSEDVKLDKEKMYSLFLYFVFVFFKDKSGICGGMVINAPPEQVSQEKKGEQIPDFL